MGQSDVTISPIQEEDVERIRVWRNKDRHCFINPNPITKRRQQHWFSNIYKKGKDYVTVYLIRFNDIPVGTIGIQLDRSSEGKRVGYIHRVMLGNKRFVRKGIMTKAMNLLMSEYACDYYLLTVLKTNETAIQFYKKYGFKHLSEDPICYLMKYEKN